MNNFSPSTDTSVGTKRFTAQEVQLAYTLMAVEYMKTIKGLNPNHQLVDKAVKLKALGFTNSKEVGDAITSEEDLKVLKCYSFLQRHFPHQEHQLSGLGFSSTMRNSVIVKVDGTFSRTLKVNF